MEITGLSVISTFSKSSVFKMFSVHTITQSRRFKFLGLEDRLVRLNGRNKAEINVDRAFGARYLCGIFISPSLNGLHVNIRKSVFIFLKLIFLLIPSGWSLSGRLGQLCYASMDLEVYQKRTHRVRK